MHALQVLYLNKAYILVIHVEYDLKRMMRMFPMLDHQNA